MNAVMARSVQKQLSWAGGNRTTKPGIVSEYKEIVDGIHVAMNESFTDYTIAQGESKIKSILRNATKN